MQKFFRFLTGLIVAAALLPLVACGGGGRRTSYTLKAEYLAEEDLLRCEMTATVFNHTENAFERLPFQLWANAYREGAKYRPISELYAPAAYYDGESYGGISITAQELIQRTIGR